MDLVSIGGNQALCFKAFPIHVALIRGTTADPDGNVTMERETMRLETLALAMAARNSGGVVLCQVERAAEANSLDARQVRVPGILIDAVVVAAPEHHMQTYGTSNPGSRARRGSRLRMRSLRFGSMKGRSLPAVPQWS